MEKSSFVLLCVLGCIFVAVQGYPHPDGQKRTDNATVIRIDAFYECLCPACKAEYPQFPRVAKILGSYVDFHTYPFGNGNITFDQDGEPVAHCQHGEAECYGNKLHACAIEQLPEQQAYLDYNACVMAGGSDDAAADACGKKLNVDSASIKTCAGGQQGADLLIWYGFESLGAQFTKVPYILLDRKHQVEQSDLLAAICDYIKANNLPINPDGCKK